eukprot:GEMP01088263.1.p1 GENE.GEMP01088263.1~~GEMP01088263.1.p1  ORF type:complete len:298 (-),score=53.89 GEMP01088263.1:24-917(-)
MSELMTRIQARYMSGGQVTLVPCSTINDVRVDIARRQDKFAPDVTVLSIDYGTVFTEDDAAPPPEVAIVINEESYDEARWHAAVIAHAKAQDAHGVKRAMGKVERFGHGSGTVFCGKVLLRLVSGRETVDVRCVSVFIECGADVNYVDENQLTSLMKSVLGGHAEIAQMLIAAAANINHVSSYGLTPLMSSASAGHAEIAQTLIAAAANLNLVTDYGLTTLMMSAMKGVSTCLSGQWRILRFRAFTKLIIAFVSPFPPTRKKKQRTKTRHFNIIKSYYSTYAQILLRTLYVKYPTLN